jgi:carboxyl-terminal processing protease
MRAGLSAAAQRCRAWCWLPVLSWLPVLLAGCGGGGGGASGGLDASPPSTAPTNTVLQASSTYAQRCAPANVNALGSNKTGSLAIEKQWIRSYFDEVYLWPDEVTGLNASAAAYSGSDVAVALDNYFYDLTSIKLTDSGAVRDRFSFTMPTAEWKALADSGVEAGYGIEWNLDSRSTPRQIRIAAVEPGSPAALADLKRGDVLLTADGVSADTQDAGAVGRLNAAIYPAQLNAAHSFAFIRPGLGAVSRTLTSANVAMTAVPLRQVLTAADGGRVGHLVFNAHNAAAETPLIEAISYLKAQAVSDLVLDLRYNGGGYLFLASELAYMIAGPSKVGAQVFEHLSYNSKRAAESRDTPFYSTSCMLGSGGCTSEKPLPTLGFSRVFVLTQSGTCSASESIINGLRGVGVEVIQIGGKTCGKPYGFVGRENCGVSYFPIEFVGTNAKGFADYADGFEPVPAAQSAGRKLPGCTVDDDFAHAVGASNEAMLAGAISYRSTGVCPARPAGSSAGLSKALAALSADAAAPLDLRRLTARGGRILGGR